jgi:hypothetical protein
MLEWSACGAGELPALHSVYPCAQLTAGLTLRAEARTARRRRSIPLSPTQHSTFKTHGRLSARWIAKVIMFVASDSRVLTPAWVRTPARRVSSGMLISTVGRIVFVG